MRNEQRYATPPGALLVYAPRALHVRGRVVVAAGDDVEQPGLELRGLRVGEERALVGEHLDAQGEDAPLVRERELALHVVVAGEAGGDQVLGAALDPLHRLADHERRRGGDHVAGVDRHLVAEPAADVGADDPDVLLGQAGDHREHGAVRVRRLRGHVDRGLAGDGVDVGEARRTSRAAPGASAGRTSRATTTRSALANAASVAAASPLSHS